LVSPHCNIGLHSFRAGGATVAANADVSERCLKKHGSNNKQFKHKYQFADSPPYVLEKIQRKGAEMKKQL
jgi:hypothetical protein